MKKVLCLLVVAAASGDSLGQILYWASARSMPVNHQIHLFNGPNHIVSVNQAPEAQGSAWGYRDGATDREGHMYFGWESGVRRHHVITGALDPTYAIDGAAPGGVGTWRALAFDPTGDGGAGSLWVANLASPLIEVDLSGFLLRALQNPGYLIYGLAYDDDDGNLWAHLGNGDVIKIDTHSGLVTPGWPSAFTPPSGRGLSGVHDGTGRIGAIGGSGPSQSGVYDTLGNMVLGPWNLPGDGFWGIAMANPPRVLGDLNCDGTLDAFDIDPFVLALTDPTRYQALWPACDFMLADITGDGVVDAFDIDPFVELLTGG